MLYRSSLRKEKYIKFAEWWVKHKGKQSLSPLVFRRFEDAHVIASMTHSPQVGGGRTYKKIMVVMVKITLLFKM